MLDCKHEYMNFKWKSHINNNTNEHELILIGLFQYWIAFSLVKSGIEKDK